MAAKLTNRQAVAAAIGKIARRAIEIPEARLTFDHAALRAADELIEALGCNARAPIAIDRRGRPRRHDEGWARDCLIAMTIESPDGLPPIQAALVDRLADRFLEAGKPVPGLTWLRKVVGAFYQSCNRLTIEARRRYRESVELQLTFETEQAYISWRKRRLMLEARWYESAELQASFESPHDYIESRLPARNLRLFAADSTRPPGDHIFSNGSAPADSEVGK